MHHSMHKPFRVSIIRFIHLVIFKDLPLLDRVGSKNSRRDFSFIPGNRTLRSVYPSSFDKSEFNLPPLATWLASAISNNINNNNCARYWANTLFLTGLTASMAVNTVFTWLGHRTDHNFGAGSNEVVFR